MVGKARAPDCINRFNSSGSSCGRADSISAAVPATIGAAKLVPTLMSKLSVQIEPPALGRCVPELLLLRIGYRQGSSGPMLMQLPAGALIEMAGPRSEKPTFEPA